MKEIFDFFNEVKNINYGWHDKDGNVHESLKNCREFYIQQDIDTILKDNHAICWEMCELQRDFFDKHNIENKTIFAFLNNDKRNICHTFSVFFMNNKCYWFEASWKNKKGIHEFNSLDEVLNYYRENFEDFAGGNYDKGSMAFIDYGKVNSGVTAEEYIKHIMKFKVIK